MSTSTIEEFYKLMLHMGTDLYSRARKAGVTIPVPSSLREGDLADSFQVHLGAKFGPATNAVHQWAWNEGFSSTHPDKKSTAGALMWLAAEAVLLDRHGRNIFVLSNAYEDDEHLDRAEHWVRGHWRLQWYGSGESRQQKPKWIRPHRRCIGNGEIADERVYVVGKEGS